MGSYKRTPITHHYIEATYLDDGKGELRSNPQIPNENFKLWKQSLSPWFNLMNREVQYLYVQKMLGSLSKYLARVKKW